MSPVAIIVLVAVLIALHLLARQHLGMTSPPKVRANLNKENGIVDAKRGSGRIALATKRDAAAKNGNYAVVGCLFVLGPRLITTT